MIRKILRYATPRIHLHSRSYRNAVAASLLAMEGRLTKAQEASELRLSQAQESLKADLAKAQDSLKVDLVKAQDSLKADLAKAQDSLKVDLVKAQDSLKADLAKAQDSLKVDLVKAQEASELRLSQAQESLKVDQGNLEVRFKSFIKQESASLLLQVLATVTTGGGLAITMFYWSGGEMVSPWRNSSKHNKPFP